MSAEPQPTSAAAVGAEEKPPEALPAAFRRMPVEASDLMKVLPHRHPFVFLDRLIELDPGRRAVGIKNVSVSDPVFAGHFPGEPIFPGIFLVEVASHVAGLVMVGTPKHSLTRGYMARIKSFKIIRLVRPGDQLRIEARLKTLVGALGDFVVSITVNKTEVASGQIAVMFSTEEAVP